MRAEAGPHGLTAFQENTTALTSFLTSMASLAAPVVGNVSGSTGSSNTTPGALAAFSSGQGGSSSEVGNVAALLAKLT